MEQFYIIASNNITLDLAYPNCEDHKKESLLVWNCPFLGVPIRYIAEIKSTWSVIHPLKTIHTKQKPEQNTLLTHLASLRKFLMHFPSVLYTSLSLNFGKLISKVGNFLFEFWFLYECTQYYFMCLFASVLHLLQMSIYISCSFFILCAFVLFLDEFYDKKICPLLYMLQIFFFHLSSLLGLWIWKCVSIVFMYLSLDIRLYCLRILISA